MKRDNCFKKRIWEFNNPPKFLVGDIVRLNDSDIVERKYRIVKREVYVDNFRKYGRRRHKYRWAYSVVNADVKSHTVEYLESWLMKIQEPKSIKYKIKKDSKLWNEYLAKFEFISDDIWFKDLSSMIWVDYNMHENDFESIVERELTVEDVPHLLAYVWTHKERYSKLAWEDLYHDWLEQRK